MFRVGLITYLMLATLTGSSLCCCTATQLASLFSRAELPGKAPQPSCCHYRSAPEGGSQDHIAKKHSGKSEHPKAPSCPCKHQPAEPVLAFPPDTLSAKMLRTNALPQDCVEFLAFLPAADLAVTSGGLSGGEEPSTFPHLTGQDILRALHILRC